MRQHPSLSRYPFPLALQGSVAVFCLLVFCQCSDKVEITQRYTYLEPIYTTTAEIRASFGILPPQPIQQTGKIYLMDHYLFINEPNEGIHVIDNTDPANPVNVSFIKIPGNFDLAGKGHILYADSYIDLLALDISDIQNVRQVKRVEDVFPYYNSYGFYPATEAVVTGWREVEVIDQLEGDEAANASSWFRYRDGIAARTDVIPTFVSCANCAVYFAMAAGGSADSGTGGSMARFTVVRDYLYTIDGANMQLFDITTLDDPQAGMELYVNFNIETIFPYEDQLFISAQDGMYIFDNSDPTNPTLLSSYTHVTSCDPVVVQNDIAYVTLRNGTECNGFANQLEVVDVSDATAPRLIATYPMDHPHGLGVDGSTLFICKGTFGLKAFDASDHQRIDDRLLAHFQDIHAYDVIPMNGVLMLIGQDGLYQYDYQDPSDIKLLSKIPTLAF